MNTKEYAAWKEKQLCEIKEYYPHLSFKNRLRYFNNILENKIHKDPRFFNGFPELFLYVDRRVLYSIYQNTERDVFLIAESVLDEQIYASLFLERTAIGPMLYIKGEDGVIMEELSGSEFTFEVNLERLLVKMQAYAIETYAFGK